jgi:hypothetical protein
MVQIKQPTDLGHKELHQLHEFVDSRSVLGGVGGDVLEGPLDVLVLGQQATEGLALCTADPTEQYVRESTHEIFSRTTNLGIILVQKKIFYTFIITLKTSCVGTRVADS